jgi:hypothetical protein
MRASWRRQDGVDIMKALRLDENGRQKHCAVGVGEPINSISRGMSIQPWNEKTFLPGWCIPSVKRIEPH